MLNKMLDKNYLESSLTKEQLHALPQEAIKEHLTTVNFTLTTANEPPIYFHTLEDFIKIMFWEQRHRDEYAFRLQIQTLIKLQFNLDIPIEDIEPETLVSIFVQLEELQGGLYLGYNIYNNFTKTQLECLEATMQEYLDKNYLVYQPLNTDSPYLEQRIGNGLTKINIDNALENINIHEYKGFSNTYLLYVDETKPTEPFPVPIGTRLVEHKANEGKPYYKFYLISGAPRAELSQELIQRKLAPKITEGLK